MSTGSGEPDSLVSAFAKVGIPAENHRFIRRMIDAADISEYRAVVRGDKPYITATRRDGGPDLHIHYGYTTGFTSEADAVRIAGTGAACRPSSRKGGASDEPRDRARRTLTRRPT